MKIAKEINSIYGFPDVIDYGEEKLINSKLPLKKILELANRGVVNVVWDNSLIYTSLNFSGPEINVPNVTDLGYYGEGINITVLDTGITKTHPNINESLILDEMNFKNDEYFQNFTDEDNGHGTHVAGIIVSNNETFRGIAYHSNIINAKVLNISGNGIDIDWREAINHYSDNSTNAPYTDIVQMSINTDLDSDGKSLMSRFIDQKVFVDGILVVICTGSVYTPLKPPADAYNSLSVGATRYNTSANEWRVWSGSGWAPTTDAGARTKVDVVAPGCSIYSANNEWNTGNWFVQKCGTSMAAPHVSGVAALLYEYARDNNKTVNPLLVKAAILNSAVKIKNWTGAEWNHTETSPLDLYSGAGQIDALKAYDTFSNERRLFSRNMTESENIDVYNIYITNAPVNLTATLVWNRHETDYTSANFPEVNDLDLILSNATNHILYSSESEFDNVEHVFYEITENGKYKIVVDNWNISKTDGWEYYALAIDYVSNATASFDLVGGWNLISLPLDMDE